jgi:serine/threonine protein kinase
MVYIHSNCIVHGNIKGANIFVNEAGRACIADRDFSSIVADTAETNSRGHLGDSLFVVPWKAPELLLPMLDEDRESRPTPATDIYALACLAYEARPSFSQIQHTIGLTFSRRFSPTNPHSGISRHAGIPPWPCSRSSTLLCVVMNAPRSLARALLHSAFMG